MHIQLLVYTIEIWEKMDKSANFPKRYGLNKTAFMKQRLQNFSIIKESAVISITSR